MAKEISISVSNPRLIVFWRGTILKRFPNAKLYEKRSSIKMWLLFIVSLMWIWNRRFFSGYTTTIGTNVYVGEAVFSEKRWVDLYATLRHEFIHMLQYEKYGIWYSASYLLPHLFAVFSLLAILAVWFSSYWLFALCAALSLAPIPSPWRARWELEGYTQSMLVTYEMNGSLGADTISRIIDKFVKSDYYFMYPFRAKIAQKINDIRIGICTGKIVDQFYPYS